MRELLKIWQPVAIGWRKCLRRVALVLVAGAMLAGCDRCGDWVSPIPGGTSSCRQDGPKPR
jgi:hypothetical protein